MIVGVPTEVKPDEYRVAMRPVGADLLTQQGHTVLIQAGAGLGGGFADQEYDVAGASLRVEVVPPWIICSKKCEIPLPRYSCS